jgi:hypothetical protein
MYVLGTAPTIDDDPANRLSSGYQIARTANDTSSRSWELVRPASNMEDRESGCGVEKR